MTTARVLRPRRVAMISVHTSPLDQPGNGDAGGLNVYVAEVSRELARRGLRVEVYTRATDPELPVRVEVAEGLVVHNVLAGPLRSLAKEELPAQLCAISGALLAAMSARASRFDLVHSHYWLSGQVGWLAKERWGIPLVHTMHTMGRVKNANLAAGDTAEPIARLVGEQQVVDAADRLVANTPTERAELMEFYDADPEFIDVVYPGVDTELFAPGPPDPVLRAGLGVPPTAPLVAFVGRIQALKAPDVLVRAVAELPGVHLVICGGASGPHSGYLQGLRTLVSELGLADRVHLVPAMPRAELADLYRSVDVVAVPSYSESFGLVAVEAQACGIPVVAARVGGLTTAVAAGQSGLLVSQHDAHEWARELGRVLGDPMLRARLAGGARRHAERFSWAATVNGLLGTYGRALASPRDEWAAVS